MSVSGNHHTPSTASALDHHPRASDGSSLSNSSSKKRRIPSPLQASVTLPSTAAAALRSPGSPRHGHYFSPDQLSPVLRATAASDALPTASHPPSSPPLSSERVRAPIPARRLASSTAQDELRSAVTRDALRDEATKHSRPTKPILTQRNVSAPLLAASPPLSPTTPTNMASSKPSPAHRPDLNAVMPRNPSIDSTTSSVSSVSAAQKLNGTGSLRVAPEVSGPQDVASLVAAAGSPEAAVQKLIAEKNQAASHNAQLWRLVEKQRAMILGLNKDLEKSLKEKERYRRKLKDSLAQSQSAPALTAAGQEVDGLAARESSQSPVTLEAKSAALPANLREMSMDSRKVSDTSDAGSLLHGRSDTPQDSSAAPSSVLPATPQSGTSANAVLRDLDRADAYNMQRAQPQEGRPGVSSALQYASTATPPMSPKALYDAQTNEPQTVTRHGHQKNVSVSSPTEPPLSATSFSSPKSKTSRKEPPAPLKLGTKNIQPVNNIVDPSDSEYEEDPESARTEKMGRGRRKTREEDDREREMLAQQEEEHPSQSKKSKSSKSKPAAESIDVSRDMAPTELPKVEAPIEQRANVPVYQPASEHGAPLHQRAVYDAHSQGLPKSSTAPALMSPGLPMSPRPGDRPMNSPMPRAPNKMLNAMPMSPKAGLPLSPRAPRQAIPMPSQTPLSLQSPHLGRAEAYQPPGHLPPTSSLAGQLKVSTDVSPESEHPSRSSDPVPMTPGEIYEGLVTEQYPELLLPPNALPSVYIKTASSRMRPSRASYLAPKVEDNPVFTLAVHERSGGKQLWRVEKTLVALAQLDQLVKSVCHFRERLPERTLFNGHAPAKIDARRSALDYYFGHMLESIVDEKSAKVICKFLSTDAIGAADGGDYFGSAAQPRVDSPVHKMALKREGYLTKRGKNFGGWKARYFQIDGVMLKYYDDRGGAQLGSIKLTKAQIGKQSNASQDPREDEDNQFRHAFLILEPKKKDSNSHVRHVLCAESDEERDAWVESLLQFVEHQGEDVDLSRPTTASRSEPLPPRSPRVQISQGDLRPPSRSRETDGVEPKTDALRAVNYNRTVAGEPPVMGPAPPSARKTGTPSPPHDANFGPAETPALQHPAISAPTNLHVISNASDWGMKPPPTPQGGKDKKRSIFAGFRGRSSSDLKEGVATPGMAPQDHYATGPGNGRAVFGVPLAEAVECARPANVVTELPAVVYRCIEYLMAKNAISEEGIFRLSGSNTVIKGLKDRFNTQGDVNLSGDGEYYDVHAVASLLKLYLRELPSSILTRDLHLEFLSCLELHGQDKVNALNVLVNKLPPANRALLEALSAFLLAIVDNSAVNKMNVRNVGIVFAPTLNVPAPLISSFVEDQHAIFGAPVDESSSPISLHETGPSNQNQPLDLRSPRKQMFSDLPTPAYNQTSFQPLTPGPETGMAPMQPTYASYQMAPQGDGSFGSLNDALRSPTVFGAAASGAPSAREQKAKKRESSMLGFSLGSSAWGGGLPKKSSMSRLREEEGSKF